MNTSMQVLLATLGFCGGIVSGTLGIGGGIVMAPLLLYVPPALALGALDMKTVSGLTMMQSLFASLSGAIAHRRLAQLKPALAAVMGVPIAAASFGGALLSDTVSSDFILATFAALALLAAAMMTLPQAQDQSEASQAQVSFNPWLAASSATAVGLVGGLVGQSGAFILIPLLIHVLRIPTRIAIGTSLAVVFCAACAGALGKIAAGQVPFAAAVSLVGGAVAGAQLGGQLTEKVEPKWLRRLLALLIGASAIRMWVDVLR